MGLKSHDLQKKAYSKEWIQLEDADICRLHEHLLEMLIDIDRVCRNNDLYYSLSGGTALGAVRHKGFIPWDDDVDVFMTRESYSRFIQLFDAQLGSKYYLHCPEKNPELGSTSIQIIKKGTLFKTIATAFSEEAGVYIDIFVLDNAPNNRLLRTIHGCTCLFFGLCLSCARYYRYEEKLLEIYRDTNKEIIKNIKTKSRIGRILSIVPLEKWVLVTNNVYSHCKDCSSRYVVCPTGIKYYFKEIFERSEYCTTTDISFEGHEFKIVKDYNTALTRLYGNYMEIPPENKREKHVALEVRI